MTVCVGGTVSSPVSALNSTELVSLAGYNYSDFGSCTDMTVSCLQDSENPFLFYRSVSLTNCVNVTHGSLTALTDQASWDQWLSNWKSSYYYAVGGVVVEVGWDLVEYVAYIVL